MKSLGRGVKFNEVQGWQPSFKTSKMTTLQFKVRKKISIIYFFFFYWLLSRNYILSKKEFFFFLSFTILFLLGFQFVPPCKFPNYFHNYYKNLLILIICFALLSFVKDFSWLSLGNKWQQVLNLFYFSVLTGLNSIIDWIVTILSFFLVRGLGDDSKCSWVYGLYFCFYIP